MSSVNIYEAKTQLSQLLRRVRAGEEIVIADHGKPVARLVPIAPGAGPRVLGADEGKVFVADDFDAPLPDNIVASFYGGDAIGPVGGGGPAGKASKARRTRPQGKKPARKRSAAR